MRLSEFMKEAPSPARTKKKATALSIPSPLGLPEQISALEKDIRQRLEKEFQTRFEGIENEKQEMSRQIQELKKKSEGLQGRTDPGLKTDPARQIESERRQMNLEMERLKDQILKKEEEIRERERLFSDEMARHLEIEKMKAEEKLRPPKIAEAEKKEEGPVPQPEKEEAPDRTAVTASPEIGIPDEKTLKAREIYAGLIDAGQNIFDQIARKQPLEISLFQTSVRTLVEFALKNDADLIEAVLEEYPDSSYFAYHAANCAILSVILGLDFKLSKNQLEELSFAAFFHDAGLLGIRENLDYPKQLTPELQSEVLRHPERGAKILQGALPECVVNAVLQHHETINGRGYPQGLAEEKIHLYAKLIQVADSFEAMTHFRPYRKNPMPVHEAIKEMIEKGRGVYDREVLKALLGRIGLYPVMSLVELSNKQIGRVVRQHPRFPLSPVVCIEFDEAGNKLSRPLVMDLTKNQLIHIVNPLKAVSSYAKVRMEHEQSQSEKKYKTVTAIQEFLPFVLIVAILALLIYIVFKI